MVQDSAAHVLDSVFQVCRQCGELSLATETDVTTLRDVPSAGRMVDVARQGTPQVGEV